jgi:hypothetical protein
MSRARRDVDRVRAFRSDATRHGSEGYGMQQTVFGPVGVREPESVELAGQLVGCVGVPLKIIPGV